MDFNGISDELKAKALACKTSEDLIELAKAEGIELSDEQLDAVSGGVAWFDCGNDAPCDPCPPVSSRLRRDAVSSTPRESSPMATCSRRRRSICSMRPV